MQARAVAAALAAALSFWVLYSAATRDYGAEMDAFVVSIGRSDLSSAGSAGSAGALTAPSAAAMLTDNRADLDRILDKLGMTSVRSSGGTGNR